MSGDCDRVSVWQGTHRVSCVPDARLAVPGHPDLLAKCSIRGREWTWCFRDANTSSLVGTVTIDGESHPRARVKNLTACAESKAAFSRSALYHVEDVLVEHGFEQVEFDSGAHTEFF